MIAGFALELLLNKFKGDIGASIYSRLSIAGAKAIHENGGTVAGPAVANLDYDWLHSIFLDGFLTYVDYLTLHPYRSITPETVMSLLQGQNIKRVNFNNLDLNKEESLFEKKLV